MERRRGEEKNMLKMPNEIGCDLYTYTNVNSSKVEADGHLWLWKERRVKYVIFHIMWHIQKIFGNISHNHSHELGGKKLVAELFLSFEHFHKDCRAHIQSVASLHEAEASALWICVWTGKYWLSHEWCNKNSIIVSMMTHIPLSSSYSVVHNFFLHFAIDLSLSHSIHSRVLCSQSILSKLQ